MSYVIDGYVRPVGELIWAPYSVLTHLSSAAAAHRAVDRFMACAGRGDRLVEDRRDVVVAGVLRVATRQDWASGTLVTYALRDERICPQRPYRGALGRVFLAAPGDISS